MSRSDPIRGEVVKLTVEVSVELDRQMRLYAMSHGIPLWEVWELAAVRLVEEVTPA